MSDPVLRDFEANRVARVLDSIYDAAVTPGSWRAALDDLAALFDCHFADLFARTHDWSEFRGCAVGLEQSDYDDIFLGVWCKRNVWSKANPVRAAGEVLATWQMIDKASMMRSDMYHEYLRPRALNEGLRLSLWADDDWIQDVSLIRPWKAGPFADGELALGRTLLPHLQRAASVSRRLGQAAGLARLEALDRPGFLLSQSGRIIRINAAAEALLARGDGVAAERGCLVARRPDQRLALMRAVAVAGGARNRLPSAASVTLATGNGEPALRLDVVPVREESCWSLPAPRAVLVIGTRHAGRAAPSPGVLVDRFGLTPAEAEFAAELSSGRSLAQIAQDSGRSIHTVRSHNARVLAKTGTRRQADALRVLWGLQPADADDAPVMRMLQRG